MGDWELERERERLKIIYTFNWENKILEKHNNRGPKID